MNMNITNLGRRLQANKRLALLASLLSAGAVVTGNAHAQAATAFTTAIATVSTDVATYGAALVGVAAIGVGFMVGMKYIKKIRGAA